MLKRVHIIYDMNNNLTRNMIKQKAIELDLKGYCHFNQHKVEVEVEGKTNAVNELIQFFQKMQMHYPEESTNELQYELYDDLLGYQSMESDLV